MMPEQFYLFTLPGDVLVWCETFGSEGHFVAPTPYSGVEDALYGLETLHPGAMVDVLCDAAELAEVRLWARTRPVEPLPLPL